jgi:DNA-3-methyladenine glycosylase
MTRTTEISEQSPLPRSFYQRPTLMVAKSLLGKYLCRKWKNLLLAGKIVEVEAYIGEDDPACHAAAGKTKRNSIMYGPPGFAYIYFIYGMYNCLNVVTGHEGFPAAVLIRAVEPIAGIEQMKRLRKNDSLLKLTNGPGKLCQAFHLNRRQNGTDFCGTELFIMNGEEINTENIATSKRVGIKVGVDHLWRFSLKNNIYVSKG